MKVSDRIKEMWIAIDKDLSISAELKIELKKAILQQAVAHNEDIIEEESKHDFI